jgi:hypothetical protein
MCTVLLPPVDNPIAVNKYIISYLQALKEYTCNYQECLKIKFNVKFHVQRGYSARLHRNRTEISVHCYRTALLPNHTE